MASDPPAEIVEKLRAVGRRRSRLLRRLAEVEAELAEGVTAADEAGVSRLAIARTAGVARDTVYKMLERRKRSR